MKALVVIVCASVLYGFQSVDEEIEEYPFGYFLATLNGNGRIPTVIRSDHVCGANQEIQFRAKPQIQLVPQGTEHGGVNSRIVGGNNAVDFPKWQVSLRRNGGHTCGGVIISSNKVLTAAHCVHGNPNPNVYDVGVGHLDLRAHTTYKISHLEMHSDYYHGSSQRDGAYPNDIAILTTTNEIKFETDVGTIERYDGSNESLQEYECMLTGWGLTEWGTIPYHLREVDINVLTDAQCQWHWGGNINDKAHVCVLDENEQAGACNGDSGGPLTCTVNGVPYLVGLASWVYSGCRTDYPSVYVDVANYKLWIDGKL